MSLNQLWFGQSPTTVGNTGLYQNAILRIKEGYNIGGSFHSIDLGDIYVDDIKHIRDQSSDRIEISASTELKKFETWRPDKIYTYTSSYVFYDDFTGTIYSDRWQASDNLFAQGGSLLTGSSNSVNHMIAQTLNGKLNNVFFEAKARADAHSGSIRFGIRTQAINDADNNPDMYYTSLDLGRDLIALYKRSSSGGATVLGISIALTSNTDYWVRMIANNDKIYSFYSTNGQQFTWLGSTFYKDPAPLGAGMVSLMNGANSTKFDDVKAFTYENVYDVRYLVNDTAFKSGLDNVSIADVYSKTFSDISGLNFTGGTWVVGTSNILTGIKGPSNSNLWDLLITGQSFVDFRYEIEVLAGISSDVGLAFGQGISAWNSFHFQGLSTNQGLTTQFASSSISTVYKSGSGTTRFIFDVPIINGYPFADQWHKYGLIKNQDKIYVLLDDVVTYAYQGLSAFNVDDYNSVGLQIFNNRATGLTLFLQARNLRVTDLSQIISDFQLTPNSTGSAVMSRLQDVGEFEYIMSGSTMRVIPRLSPDDATLRTYDIGSSHYAWDVDRSGLDNLINHVTVYGKDGIRGDAWDNDLLTRIGKERVRVITDETVTSYPDAVTLAQKFMTNTNRNSTSISYDNNSQVDLEKYDVINIVNKYTGTSGSFRIYGVKKTFNPESGSFDQSLQLGNR